MEGKFIFRKIPEECEPNFDTLTIIEPEEKLRKLFIETLVREGFGTKNLPDAMEWHCTAFWDHVILLQPTSPLLRVQDISNALKHYRIQQLESLVGVVPMIQHPNECIEVPEHFFEWSYLK